MTQNRAQLATITLTNDTPVGHSLAADNGSFITGTLDPFESATLNLTQAGDYVYRCRIHLDNAAESGIIHVFGPLPAPAPSATLIPGTPTLPTVTIPIPSQPQPLNN